MKKTFIIVFIAFILVYCHSKKKATETISVKKTTASSSTQLQIAQKRWANATADDLAEGKIIFEGKCTNCHGAKNIPTRSEKSWLHEIKDMSPKANLTPAEKEKLTRYVLSFREKYTSTD